MLSFEQTLAPLPDGYEPFSVHSTLDGRPVSVAGFVFDPDHSLEDPAQAVIVGAGNTYVSRPYSRFPLQVASELHKKTAMPVVGVESFGVHSRSERPIKWTDGYPYRQKDWGRFQRDVMLTLAENLGLFERELHHEGHSQAATQPPIRTATTGEADGILHKTLTLFDPAGMRYFPKALSLPRFVQKTLLHPPEPTRVVFDPAIEEYSAAHPESEKWVPLRDFDPRFVPERLGSRRTTARWILESLMSNPQLECVLASCENGNGVFSTPRSTLRLLRLASYYDRGNLLKRLQIAAPEGLPHQWADVPKNRAQFVAAHILGGPIKAAEVIDTFNH